MSVLLITYDLNKPGQSYTKVIEFIKKFDMIRLSESSYAIETKSSSEQIYKALKPLIDSNDNLYIIPLTSPAAGQGPEEVNQWIVEHLNRVPQQAW